MLTISGKAPGQKKALFADWAIPLPPDLQGEGGTTLRDVISRVVREEVAAFRERQADQRVLRVLTARQINKDLERGKVQMGQSEVPHQEVDEKTAVGTALQAFEDGLYLVVIDDQELRSLDSAVFLQPDSRITFIRLTMLAGG